MTLIADAIINLVGTKRIYQMLQAANNRVHGHALGRRNKLAAKLAKVEDAIARSRELDADISAELKAL